MDLLRDGVVLLSETTNYQTFVLFFVVLVLTYTVLSYAESDIPGPLALPLIGNSLNIISVKSQHRHIYLKQLHKKYGDIFRLYFGRRLVVFLNSYELVNEAFVQKSDIFTHRPDFIIGRSGNGLIWSNGTKWKLLRRLSLRALKDFGSVEKKSMQEVIQQEARGILEQIEKKNGQDFKSKEILSIAAANVVHNLMFGFRYSQEDPYFRDLMSKFDNFLRLSGSVDLSLSHFYPILLLFQLKGIRKTVANIIEHLQTQINEHETTFDGTHIRDYVDLYIKTKNESIMEKDIFTKDDLLLIVLDIFVAGTETTSTVLEWALLYVIEHPDVQEKCHDEIMQVVGHSRMVNSSDRNNLPYVNATISEILRMASATVVGVPHMAAQDCYLKGYYIPKRTVIVALQATIHIDSRNWEQPDIFRPERFLDRKGNFIKPAKSMPFSIGPRICMGESLAMTEMFVFIANMLQRFLFIKNKTSDVYDFVGNFNLTVSPIPYDIRAMVR